MEDIILSLEWYCSKIAEKNHHHQSFSNKSLIFLFNLVW